MTPYKQTGPVAAFLLVIMSSALSAQSDVRVRGVANSRPVSERVVATYQIDQVGDQPAKMFLLIMYRDQPNWHHADRDGQRFGVTDQYRVGPQGQLLGSFSFQQRMGGIELPVHVDRTAQQVRIQGQIVSLQNINAIVVDNAAAANGQSRILATIRINVELSLRSDIGDIIRRHPELSKYLE